MPVGADDEGPCRHNSRLLRRMEYQIVWVERAVLATWEQSTANFAMFYRSIRTAHLILLVVISFHYTNSSIVSRVAEVPCHECEDLKG